MKKVISFMLLLVTSISLISCGNNENAPSEDVIPKPDKAETVNLKVVFSETGKELMLNGAGNSGGFYDIVDRIWNLGEQMSTGEFDCNIVYTDYSSKTRVYLCNDPSCRHNTEDCTSYIKTTGAGVKVFPVEDYLICMRSGKSDRTAEKEEDLSAIIIMGLDGSNRRKYLLSADESFTLPFIVLSDENRIYFQIVSVNEGNTEKKVLSIDLDTGERKTETEIPMSYMLVSAYDDCMVFYDTESVTNMIFSLSEKAFNKSLSGVSGIYNANFSFDLEFDVDITDFHNILKAKSITVIVSDIKDKSIQKYGPYPLEDDHAGVMIINSNDDHVCVRYISNLSSGGDEVSYDLDLTTGMFEKRELYVPIRGGSYPVPVIADAGDSYLVEYDMTYVVQTFYDRQGVVHTVDNNSYLQYALIKKEDYYSNTPNYEIIKDTLCEVG